MKVSRWTTWQTPTRTGYRFTCCDCLLVHEMQFRLIGKRDWRVIQFRVARDTRGTNARRRKAASFRAAHEPPMTATTRAPARTGGASQSLETGTPMETPRVKFRSARNWRRGGSAPGGR